jgi:hypothetical protein
VWRKTNKGGLLIEAYQEFYGKIQYKNFLQKISGEGFSSPQALYDPTNSTLLVVAVIMYGLWYILLLTEIAPRIGHVLC